MSRLIPLLLALAFLFAVSPVEAQSKKFVKKKTSKFSTSNKNKEALGPGTVNMPSGIQYKDLKVGEGKKLRRGQSIKIHYVGTLYPSGKEFDNSVKRGVPFLFRLGTPQVMKGWNIGIASMKVGGKRELLIPPELGHGNKRVGRIPANSTLKYEIQVLEAH